MIFIFLKNWKSKSETRFLVEPNRFELLPNATQSVKFYLNAESPISADEEFTIEGCSSSFPIREVIRESKLKANVIRPTLNFSEDEIVINCFYGDDKKDHSSEWILNLFLLNSTQLPFRADSNHKQIESSAPRRFESGRRV